MECILRASTVNDNVADKNRNIGGQSLLYAISNFETSNSVQKNKISGIVDNNSKGSSSRLLQVLAILE